jgi:hypothetical protein
MMISRSFTSEESASTPAVRARAGFFNFRDVVMTPPPLAVRHPVNHALAPWEQADTLKSVALPHKEATQRQRPGLKKQHLLLFVVVMVLMHLSQLMAKNDEHRGNWTPPIEPPGSVIVTSLSERSGGQPSPTQAAQATVHPTTSVAAAAAVAAPSTPAAPVAASGTEHGLRQALQQWSQAWSGQAMAPYLGMYASDFEPPKGLSRSAWEQQRTQRITRKKSIRHDMQNLTLQINTHQATVHFTQIYQDERLQSSDQKTMVWVWRNGQWQITREFTA